MLGGADKSNGDLGTYITGADTLLQQAILPPISNEVLQRKRTGQELQNIQLMVENDSLSVYFD